MFFSGSLQEGISAAVEQQKMIVCFVTNDNEESRLWENDFLREASLGELIENNAVALRLEAGSPSAAYLAELFPLPQTPTVVLIKHGELKDYIASGTVKDDFVRRVRAALDVSPPPAPSTATPAAAPASAPVQAEETASSTASDMRNVHSVLAERVAKLKAKKEEADRRAKDERAEAKAKAAAEAEAGADTEAARSHRQAELVRKQRQQKDEERRRILARIENDKQERRQRAAQRQQMRADALPTGDVASSLVKAPESKLPSTTRISDMASIQVRLFDGSTMRNRFKTCAPFTQVRGWVDDKRTDGSVPYTFRQLLTPRPNTAIDETDEAKTLSDLGLAPSSTLILIPVQTFSTAYEANKPQSWLSRFVAAISGLLLWLASFVPLGFARRTTGSAPVVESSSGRTRRRISGFDDVVDPSKDQQLYNGNSLNFEPRPDEQDDA
ncbi:hypothetical protein CDD80_7464 [Ophiocordyceps camponoti-rufipedis]|uniref:UBX domain-containing protein 2 n=1 Tax=Ophiocordyceps camponoti-rufipedis TaxID=2004952 RepID=A0A2C5YNC0_9HYPO|nr:hypothetical protein CDD80_7464 [Ophiocordyceps camponoti-rufipedis]